MSEYIEFETDLTADPAVMIISTNLVLTDEDDAVESYGSREEMEVGSPLAQMLASVEGVVSLQINGNRLIVGSDGDTAWHFIVAEITAVVREFFL